MPAPGSSVTPDCDVPYVPTASHAPPCFWRCTSTAVAVRDTDPIVTRTCVPPTRSVDTLGAVGVLYVSAVAADQAAPAVFLAPTR